MIAKKTRLKFTRQISTCTLQNAVLMEDSLKKLEEILIILRLLLKVHITLSHHADVLPPKIESCYPGIKPKLH